MSWSPRRGQHVLRRAARVRVPRASLVARACQGGGAVASRGVDARAAIAQLGERQTEDLKVPGSIPGHGISLLVFKFLSLFRIET